MDFSYTTKNGAEVDLSFNSLDDIKCSVSFKGTNFKADAKIVGVRIVFNEPVSTEFGMIKGLETNKVFESHLRKLLKEKRFNEMNSYEKAKLIAEEAYLPNIRTIAPDLITGNIYYTFKEKVDKQDWKKVSHLFNYIDSNETDCVDFMDTSSFKGYATIKPKEVCEILFPNWEEEYNKKKELYEIEKNKLEEEKNKKLSNLKDIFEEYKLNDEIIKTLSFYKKHIFDAAKNNFNNIKESHISYNIVCDVLNTQKKYLTYKDLLNYKLSKDYDTEIKYSNYYNQKILCFNENNIKTKHSMTIEGYFAIGERKDNKRIVYHFYDSNLSEQYWGEPEGIYNCIWFSNKRCKCDIYLLDENLINFFSLFMYKMSGSNVYTGTYYYRSKEFGAFGEYNDLENRRPTPEEYIGLSKEDLIEVINEKKIEWQQNKGLTKFEDLDIEDLIKNQKNS